MTPDELRNEMSRWAVSYGGALRNVTEKAIDLYERTLADLAASQERERGLLEAIRAIEGHAAGEARRLAREALASASAPAAIQPIGLDGFRWRADDAPPAPPDASGLTADNVQRLLRILEWLDAVMMSDDVADDLDEVLPIIRALASGRVEGKAGVPQLSPADWISLDEMFVCHSMGSPRDKERIEQIIQRLAEKVDAGARWALNALTAPAPERTGEE